MAVIATSGLTIMNNVDNDDAGGMPDPKQAERLTTQIASKLDAMADAYAGVMPWSRELITRKAYVALGYRSVGEYVSDRFDGLLAKAGARSQDNTPCLGEVSATCPVLA